MALLSRQAKEWLVQKHILGFISHRVISGGCQPRPLVGKCPLFGFSAVDHGWPGATHGGLDDDDQSIVSFSDGAGDIETEWS